MRVMSINCQNNEANRRGGRSESGYDFCLMLANYIEDCEYDYIGTQEMSALFTDKMQDNLPEYKFSGKYRNRLALIRKVLPSLQGLIENNKLIFKGTLLKETTFSLPWMPHSIKEIKYALKRKSLMRRIVSSVLVDTEELGQIYFVNTHLDYALKSIQKRQLDKLYKYILKIRKDYPVVLTGDFNMEISNEYFSEFIINLEKIGIKRVPIDDKTDALKYRHKTAIDHIFIPKEYEILQSGTVQDDNIKEITDHLAIYVEFRK